MTEYPRPWSTQPITGAQADAWLAEEREREKYPQWVISPEAYDALLASTRNLLGTMTVKVSDLKPGSVVPTVGEVVPMGSMQSCEGCEWSDLPHWHGFPVS